MLEEQQRHQSVQEQILGTRHPYLNVGKSSFFSKITNTLRRATSAINPFAKVQVEVEDEISFVPESNIAPYLDKLYPNSVKKERGIFRPHFDIE